jgi:hypothetical protein
MCHVGPHGRGGPGERPALGPRALCRPWLNRIARRVLSRPRPPHSQQHAPGRRGMSSCPSCSSPCPSGYRYPSHGLGPGRVEGEAKKKPSQGRLRKITDYLKKLWWRHGTVAARLLEWTNRRAVALPAQRRCAGAPRCGAKPRLRPSSVPDEDSMPSVRMQYSKTKPHRLAPAGLYF